MGTTKQRQAQLKRLYLRQDKLCWWCKKVMLPPGSYHPKKSKNKKPPDLLCTYDHLDSRLSPERGKHPREYRNVAACWKCNNDRAQQEEAMADRELLWRKSGAYPQNMRHGPHPRREGASAAELLTEKFKIAKTNKGELRCEPTTSDAGITPATASTTPPAARWFRAFAILATIRGAWRSTAAFARAVAIIDRRTASSSQKGAR